MLGVLAGQPDVHRETFLRECERRFEDLGQRHRAEFGQRGRKRVEGGRNSRRQEPRIRHQLQSEGAIMLNRRARGRDHIAVDGDHAACRCRVDEHRRLATDGMHMWIHDALDQHCGDRRIDGIATPCENSGAGGS